MITRYTFQDLIKQRLLGDEQWVKWTDHVADTCKLRDKLLELARECSMLIRLAPMTTSPRVLPVARIKLGIGGRSSVPADPKQRAKGVERVKPSVKSERKFVQISLQVLRRYAVMATPQPAFQV